MVNMGFATIEIPTVEVDIDPFDDLGRLTLVGEAGSVDVNRSEL